MIKIEITIGAASINVDGSIDDVAKILDTYWLPYVSKNGSQLFDAAADTIEAPDSSRPAKRKKKSRPSPSTSSNDGASTILNAEELANSIKRSEEFSAIDGKILAVNGEWIKKCKLVAKFAGEPITSGDVSRTLDKLKIKHTLPTLSKTLSGNANEFLTEGTSPVKYEMTRSAAIAFDEWLVAPNAE